jgi:uncharacterized protein with HEPN domain
LNSEEVYLLHILDAIGQIEEYTSGGEASFFAERMVQDAVIRNVEIIGEAVKQLPEELRDEHPEIPWSRIAGMRDMLIHQYSSVDLQIVWSVVENRLPELHSLVKSLLNDKDGGVAGGSD